MAMLEEAYLLCKHASADRDESHNYDHSLRVVANAMEILSYESNAYQSDDVKVVAILHDVADYKYDEAGHWKDRIMQFLDKYYPSCKDDVWQAIDTISYSKEKKHGARWYERVITSKYWIEIRNIVSDADKLDALYTIGAIRCAQYGIKELTSRSVEVTPALIVDHLNQHVIDKLGILYKYFRTTYGQEAAIEGTSQLCCAVSNITINYINDKPLY
jgi:HD superfamily phosphodiesterase